MTTPLLFPKLNRHQYIARRVTLILVIASGGAYGIKKHLSTSKHQEVARISSCSSSLISMFQQPIEDKVTRAEVLFASFVAEQ